MVLKIELEKEALEILKDETEVRVDYLKDDKREMEEDDDGDSTWFSPTNWAEVWDFLRNGEPGEVYTIDKVSIAKNMPGILVKSIFRDLKGKKMIEEFEPGKFRISKGMGD